MWLVGAMLVFAAAVATALAIGWMPRQSPSRQVWDIANLGGTYTGIVGTLGGFSVTSAIFVAGLDGARTSPEFGAVIGMLLVAFLILVFSALMYASAPNAPVAARQPLDPDTLAFLVVGMDEIEAMAPDHLLGAPAEHGLESA